jgi:hypothetical protein
MTLHAYEVPSYFLCAECGYSFEAIRLTKRVPGKIALQCPNGSCRQYGQPFYFRFKELVLEDKVHQDDIL